MPAYQDLEMAEKLKPPNLDGINSLSVGNVEAVSILGRVIGKMITLTQAKAAHLFVQSIGGFESLPLTVEQEPLQVTANGMIFEAFRTGKIVEDEKGQVFIPLTYQSDNDDNLSVKQSVGVVRLQFSSEQGLGESDYFVVESLARQAAQIVAPTLIQRLSKSIHRYADVLENSDKGTALINPDLHIELVNSRAQVLFGQKSLGRSVEEVFGSQGQVLTDAIRSVLNKGARASWHNLEVNLGDEQQKRILTVDLIPVRNNPSEAPRGVLMEIVDETEQAELESGAASFIAVVSHDLRTPLTVIKGFAETLTAICPDLEYACNELQEMSLGENIVELKKVAGDIENGGGELESCPRRLETVAGQLEAQRNKLESIASLVQGTEALFKEFSLDISGASDRMLRMVQDLLSIVQLINGADLVMKMDQFTLKDELETLVNEHMSSAKMDTRYSLDMLDEDAQLTLFADKDRLFQVLGNFMSNADRYAKERGSEVVLRVREVEGEDGRSEIRFEVEDYGIGIPEEQLEKLFKKFGRVESESHRDRKGHGLGLFLTKHIVEAHGGTIGVKSVFGQGSTFWCQLPRYEQNDN